MRDGREKRGKEEEEGSMIRARRVTEDERIDKKKEEHIFYTLLFPAVRSEEG